MKNRSSTKSNLYSPLLSLRNLITLLLVFYSSITFAKNELELVISAHDIAKRLTTVAAEIDRDYLGEELTLVMVLKGSLLVTADLMRELKTPLTLEYIKATTHDANGHRMGQIILEGIEKLDLKGKNVLVLDDACGTGATLLAIVEKLKEKEPKSIKSLAVVLFLQNGAPVTHFQPNYTLFKLEDRYIVGYGLDHKQRYRNLPGIYELINYD